MATTNDNDNCRSSDVDNCKIVELGKKTHQNGNLTVVENLKDIPFETKRIYYLYDVPGGSSRGGHAHRQLFQLIVAISGSFNVNIFDGVNHKTFFLNRPYEGLLITPGIWRTIDNFSSGSVCLVLASENFNEEDYIRNYDDFLALTENKRQNHD